MVSVVSVITSFLRVFEARKCPVFSGFVDYNHNKSMDKKSLKRGKNRENLQKKRTNWPVLPII